MDAITFEFEPFPPLQDRLSKLLKVEKSRRPSIVDPRDVARLIALGKRVMALVEDEKVYYITSDNPDYPYPGLMEQMPTCFDQEQDWSKSIPWERLGKMTVRKMGDCIVFVDWSSDYDRVTTRKYRVIPRLRAFALMATANL